MAKKNMNNTIQSVKKNKTEEEKVSYIYERKKYFLQMD